MLQCLSMRQACLKSEGRRATGVFLVIPSLIFYSSLNAAAQSPHDEAPPGVSFPDVPVTNFAYQAVNDLAKKGYFKGYPDGEFKGEHVMSRYEFAVVIERMLETVSEINAKVSAVSGGAAQAPVTPNGSTVTQDDLNKIQVLVDTFRKEIDIVTADVPSLKGAGYQARIDQLRKELTGLKDQVADAQAEAKRAYGFGPGQFQISGYIQARFEQIQSGSQAAYPSGVTANVGPAQSYNGNYAAGGNNESFFLRRTRLRIAGGVTTNTQFGILVDASNSNASTPIDVREVDIFHTFGDGNPNRYPTITAGQFANYFGTVISESGADFLGIERPLAFSDASSGLWQNQDYDRGASLTVPFGNGFKALAGIVNGTGRGAGAGVSNSLTVGASATSTDNKRRPDEIYRLAYRTQKAAGFKLISVAGSHYEGELSRSAATNAAGDPAFTGVNYEGLKKQLTGADIVVKTNGGITLQGEYVSGRFDERTFTSAETSTGIGTTFITNAYAPNNHVDGYYIQAGYTLPTKGNATRPLTFSADYDVFNRSKSGVSNGQKDSSGQAILGGASGSTFTDKNYGYGVSYNFDKQFQLKFWYDQPLAVSHAANLPEPAKIGLFTTQFQVRF